MKTLGGKAVWYYCGGFIHLIQLTLRLMTVHVTVESKYHEKINMYWYYITWGRLFTTDERTIKDS
jgi:hypothetical protein